MRSRRLLSWQLLQCRRLSCGVLCDNRRGQMGSMQIARGFTGHKEDSRHDLTEFRLEHGSALLGCADKHVDRLQHLMSQIQRCRAVFAGDRGPRACSCGIEKRLQLKLQRLFSPPCSCSMSIVGLRPEPASRRQIIPCLVWKSIDT